MRSESNAATFFDSFAEAFDTIYDGKRNSLMQWIDRRFRSDELGFQPLHVQQHIIHINLLRKARKNETQENERPGSPSCVVNH